MQPGEHRAHDPAGAPTAPKQAEGQPASSRPARDRRRRVRRRRRRSASVRAPDVSSRSTATPHTAPITVGSDVDDRRARRATSTAAAAGDPGQRRSPCCRSAAAWSRPSPAERGDHRDHRSTSTVRNELVGGAEGGDRPFLDRAGRQVDDRRPDRGARRRPADRSGTPTSWATPSGDRGCGDARTSLWRPA